jgi:pimeloyl-ACP methyl ester carboxylesterase
MEPTQPLWLVPGLMCDHAVWDDVLPHLGPNVQAHVVDHGEADSLQRMAEQLLAHAPAHVLLAGHSMGARVVVEALRLAPERIGGVALLDTGYLPKPAGTAGHEEANKRQALLAIAQREGVRAMAKVWSQGMVHPDRLSDHALMDRILDMFDRKTALIFEHQIHALLNRPNGSDVLANIQVPTLVLCGRQDAWSPVAQHQAMHALIPQSHLVLIEQAGHMAPMEKPVEVAQALTAWLQRCH